MNEQKNYIAILIACVIVFVAIYFICRSDSDERGSQDTGTRIEQSTDLNQKIQDRIGSVQEQSKEVKREIDDTYERLGRGKTELDRAEESIKRCQSVIGEAKKRAEEKARQPKKR